MKKLLCSILAVLLMFSSISALAAEIITPVIGNSPISATASVDVRTINVNFSSTPFSAGDDVTFLFYKPESDVSDNIIDDGEHIIYADQINFDAAGFSFSVDMETAAGTYNLLIGGTDVDVPCLIKNIKLADAVKYGDVTLDTKVDSADLVLLAQYLAEFESALLKFESSIVKEAANVRYDFLDGTQKIDSADLVLLAQHLAEFESAKNLPLIP